MDTSDSGWERVPQWADGLWTHRLLVPLAILCFAAALRLIYLWEDSASPFFVSGGVDSPTYLRRVAQWAEGSWPGAFAFDQPPLYPAWLVAVGHVLGKEVGLLKLAQAMLGSASCLIVYFVAKKSFRDFTVAVVAASMCAVNGAFIYFDGQIVSANLETFLQCVVLLLLLQADEKDRLGWWVAAGAAIGLSVINRGGILFCLPFVVFWIFQRRDWADGRGGWSFREAEGGLRRALAVMVPVLLCIAPVSVHNFRNDASRSVPEHLRRVVRLEADKGTFERVLNQEFVLLTARTGMNFYLGNSFKDQELNDPNHPLCFGHTNYVMKLPFRTTSAVSASAHQDFLMQLTWNTIAEEPGRWLQLMSWKLVQLVNGVETPRNSNPYADRQYSTVLSALLWRDIIAFPSGLIIPLGLLGIYFDRANWRRRFVLTACILPRALFVLTFFVAARNRMPMIPILSIFASFALCHLIRSFRDGGLRGLAGPVAAFVLLASVSNAPLIPARAEHGAYEYFNLGNWISIRGAPEVAIPHFRRAVEVDPTSPASHYFLGSALERLRQYEEAEVYLREAVRLDPGFVEARALLGRNLKRKGRVEEAKEQYLRVLQIDPNNERARLVLARLGA